MLLISTLRNDQHSTVLHLIDLFNYFINYLLGQSNHNLTWNKNGQGVVNCLGLCYATNDTYVWHYMVQWSFPQSSRHYMIQWTAPLGVKWAFNNSYLQGYTYIIYVCINISNDLGIHTFINTTQTVYNHCQSCMANYYVIMPYKLRYTIT